jgi:DNA-directed RNA polymerase subunit L
MELRAIQSGNDILEIEIQGEDHTLVNFLRHALWDVKGVKEAGYLQKHPLVSDPRLTVRVDGVKPKKALELAVAALKEQVKELKSLAKKLA